MQIRQRHQHFGMPILQIALEVFPLPGKRAEQQAYQLGLVDTVGFAKLHLVHIALLVAAWLASQS
ncbi:hypothetical protein D3C80_2098120 [compost metagenome]